MDSGWAYIWAASITTLGGVIAGLIQRFRKENKKDHGIVRDTLSSFKEEIKEDLNEIKSDFKDVNKKLDNHIDWHIKK
jgi:hypothetical protein